MIIKDYDITTGEETEIVVADKIITEEETKQFKIADIKAQLQELDEVMPRISEDIITATGIYSVLDTRVKERYDSKQNLRAQLRSLQN